MPPRGWSASVLTVSDRSSKGLRPDASGPRVASALSRAGFRVVERRVVPDERARIARTLRSMARRAALVVTTGGTGVAARDVTPEATRDAVDREVPGLGEAMRAASVRKHPHAVLSRATAGTLGTSLVLNLPGSPRGASECLSAVLEVLPHALDLLGGRGGDAHP